MAEFKGWRKVLSGVDMLIHAAARVHVLKERASNPLAEFRRVNTALTAQLARQAAQCGVRRFVYISSIAVNGQTTGFGQVFSESDCPQPQDPYGVSKWEAEMELSAIAAGSALEVVIVRPPAVYGPNLRGHLQTLLGYIHSGIPLPLGSIRNARSFISIENLCRFLFLCATDERASGETFLIADERAVPTPELFRLLAEGMGRPARLYPMPDLLLKAACFLSGRQNIHRRLCESLVIDSAKAARVLDWHAPIGVEDALQSTGRWYAEQRRQQEKRGTQECLDR